MIFDLHRKSCSISNACMNTMIRWQLILQKNDNCNTSQLLEIVAAWRRFTAYDRVNNSTEARTRVFFPKYNNSFLIMFKSIASSTES